MGKRWSRQQNKDVKELEVYTDGIEEGMHLACL